MTFLVNGATRFGEPGVFMSFEERAADLAANFASLGYDLDGLVAAGKLAIDHVRVERSEIEETGEYDLEGLFVRLGYAVDTIGAKRVVLDTIESLFSGFTDPSILRAELRRLFGWLKDRGLTAVITGERGDGQLTRQGLEEYVSDCVILLDNRVEEQITTRRLRVVKYRGSAHGTNEYPFLIDGQGISVLPVTSSGLPAPGFERDHPQRHPGPRRHAPDRRVLSRLQHPAVGRCRHRQDDHRQPFRRRRLRARRTLPVLRVRGGCRRDLPQRAVRRPRPADSVSKAACCGSRPSRPSLFGLEMHLARMHRDLDDFKPDVVVIDPISAFRGPDTEVHATLLRMLDLLKSRGITGPVHQPAGRDDAMAEGTDHGLSSLMDVWIKLSDIEANGERNRMLYVIKSRGMSHSNQVREYRVTDSGIELIDAYIGPEGVLTGTARLSQEARERAAASAPAAGGGTAPARDLAAPPRRA